MPLKGNKMYLTKQFNSGSALIMDVQVGSVRISCQTEDLQQI